MTGAHAALRALFYFVSLIFLGAALWCFVPSLASSESRDLTPFSFMLLGMYLLLSKIARFAARRRIDWVELLDIPVFLSIFFVHQFTIAVL